MRESQLCFFTSFVTSVDMFAKFSSINGSDWMEVSRFIPPLFVVSLYKFCSMVFLSYDSFWSDRSYEKELSHDCNDQFLVDSNNNKVLKTLTSFFGLGNGYIYNVTFLSSLDILLSIFWDNPYNLQEDLCTCTCRHKKVQGVTIYITMSHIKVEKLHKVNIYRYNNNMENVI